MATFEGVSGLKKEELDDSVINKIVKEEGGIFSWKDSKGENRQVYVKKNHSFIDRKHAQLRYQLYKKIESQTNTGKLKKEWKEGQMYINGKAHFGLLAFLPPEPSIIYYYKKTASNLKKNWKARIMCN